MCNTYYETIPFFCNEYETVTRIFRNWFIVEKRSDDSHLMGIVDSNNNTILSLDKYYIFANDNMVFVNGFGGRGSFVWDSNGQYLSTRQNNVRYTTVDSNGCPEELGYKDYYRPNKIVVYYIVQEKRMFYLYVPGRQPSTDALGFLSIEKLNDFLLKYSMGETSYWGNTVFGLLNIHGNIVLPCKYQILDNINGIFYLVKDIDDYGNRKYETAVDFNGHVLANFEDFNCIKPLEDGFVLFKKKDSWGLMAPSFAIVIPPTYSELSYVEHNVLRFRGNLIDYDENGLILHNEEYINLPDNYCYAQNLSDNLFCIYKKEGKGNPDNQIVSGCGLISVSNHEFNTIMPFEYSRLSLMEWNGNKCILFEQNSKTGFADLRGNILLQNIYDGFYEVPTIGSINASYIRTWNEDSNEKKLFGLLSSSFKEVLPPIHQILYLPKENTAVFMINSIWGIYSLEHDSAKFFPKYSSIGDFTGGLSIVNHGGKSFFVKDPDNLHDDESYTIHEFFNDEWHIVKGGLWGVINKEGEEIIPCVYDTIEQFMDNKALVKREGKWGLIDTIGKEIVPIIYEDITICSNGVYILHRDDMYGFITPEWEFIDCKYSDVMMFKGDLIPFCENNLWGFIDLHGKIAIPPQYNEVRDNNTVYYCIIGSKLYYGQWEEEYDIVDYTGNIISSIRLEEPEYIPSPLDDLLGEQEEE